MTSTGATRTKATLQVALLPKGFLVAKKASYKVTLLHACFIKALSARVIANNATLLKIEHQTNIQTE